MLTETVEVTRDLWQSWAVTVGGLVGAVLSLSVLAKVPGGRHAFKFLVADPVAKWMDARMDRKIAPAVAHAVRIHVAECLDPIEQKIDAINHAVNNVGPDMPPLKDRVGGLERGQKVTDAKVDVAIGMLESLVHRP